MTKMSSRAIILKLESKSFLSFINSFFIITLSTFGQFGIWLKKKRRCVYGTKRRVQRLLRPKTALLPCRWKHRHVLFLVEQGMLALVVQFDTKRHVQRLLASKKCPSTILLKASSCSLLCEATCVSVGGWSNLLLVPPLLFVLSSPLKIIA